MDAFMYDFEVDEEPGTYWWHTHSGAMHVSQDLVKGPLIVHDCTDPARRALVDDIAAGVQDSLAYADERILFMTDFFNASAHSAYLEKQGGLRQDASKGEYGLAVGFMEWVGGLINGSPRATIPVPLGKSTMLRVINSATVFWLKFGIDELRLSVVGTDGNPSEPLEVDEVIIGSAERFDVRVTLPASKYAVGDTLWIRAETLENRAQGYDRHAIVATLVVTAADAAPAQVPAAVSEPKSQAVADPVVLNCFQYDGRASEKCLHITEMRSHPKTRPAPEVEAAWKAAPVDTHLLDFAWLPPPFYATFVAHNRGLFKQHVTPTKPMVAPSFDLEEDLHPNTVVLDLAADATVIMVYRTATRFAHPIHIHGHRFEVLEIVVPELEKDCTRTRCERTDHFDSPDKIRELAARPRSAVLKDTFMLPAGGAAAIRFQADNPGAWLGHCHIKSHAEDGMMWVMREGGFAGLPAAELPATWPDCDSPFSHAHPEYPACACHDNRDAVLELRLTEVFRCSRHHTCKHVDGSTARIEASVFQPGIHAHQSLALPGWTVAIIGAAAAIFLFKAAEWAAGRMLPGEAALEREEAEGGGAAGAKAGGRAQGGAMAAVEEEEEEEGSGSSEGGAPGKMAEAVSVKVVPEEGGAAAAAGRPGFAAQVWVVVQSEWRSNYPNTINVYRLVEVLGLGMVTGFVFWEIGSQTTNRALRESISLLFFSVTLWTFNRMYPAVVMYTQFREQLVVHMATAEVTGVPLCPCISAQVLGRGIVCVLLESLFPVLFGLVAFPMAHVIGDPQAWVQHMLLLSLNTLAYAFIGGAVGTLVPRVPVGMIIATLISQTTLVCAGFYVSLPSALRWVRYVSPVFYTFSGMVRGAYRTTDSFECNGGDSFLGANWCFLEFSGSIDDLKQRGINVATYNDPSSNTVWPNILVLALYCALLQVLIYVCLRTWGAALMNETLGKAATWMGAPIVEMEAELDHADDPSLGTAHAVSAPNSTGAALPGPGPADADAANLNLNVEGVRSRWRGGQEALGEQPLDGEGQAMSLGRSESRRRSSGNSLRLERLAGPMVSFRNSSSARWAAAAARADIAYAAPGSSNSLAAGPGPSPQAGTGSFKLGSGPESLSRSFSIRLAAGGQRARGNLNTEEAGPGAGESDASGRAARVQGPASGRSESLYHATGGIVSPSTLLHSRSFRLS